jgi:hypothetical protein
MLFESFKQYLNIYPNTLLLKNNLSGVSHKIGFLISTVKKGVNDR